jgi:ubiquinone/menaquinone biosynthesis C-methylase UbiE
MRLTLPDQKSLNKTGEVDYFMWNYKFPIKYIQKYRFKRIIQLLGDLKYNSLLEVGTGSGIFLPELSKHCEQLYACDIHSNFDNIANLCKKFEIKNYNLSTQSIESTNFPDESFDVVVAVSVLEFVPDIQKAVTEIKRILKKDGIFITICPMENKFLDFFLSLYTKKTPKEEFGDSRQNVSSTLEQNFIVIKKGFMLPIIGKLFPVYTHYKLQKPSQNGN